MNRDQAATQRRHRERLRMHREVCSNLVFAARDSESRANEVRHIRRVGTAGRR